jgi:hypothetical protein
MLYRNFPVDSPLYITVAFALLLPDLHIGDRTRRFGKDAGNETHGE